MDIWQIVVIVVLAALILVWVAVIAYNKGRVSGRLAADFFYEQSLLLVLP